jgi:colanic acid biosynthesis protein WcaH
MIRKVKFLPKDVYEIVLKWVVIPTFDVLIEYGNQGFIFVRRKIAPYKDVWAFPGLRMLKGEEINDTLERISFWELGLKIDFKDKIFLGQYVGKFQLEQKRQDLSTGFYIKISDKQQIKFNKEHFYSMKITKKIPTPIGAMYKYYFEQYLRLQG